LIALAFIIGMFTGIPMFILMISKYKRGEKKALRIE